MKRVIYILVIAILLLVSLSSCITEEEIQGEAPMQSVDPNGDNINGDGNENNDNKENGNTDGGDTGNDGTSSEDNDGDGATNDDTDGGENGKVPDEPSHTHEYSEWIIVEQPTCTEIGSKKKECTSCGEALEVASIDATGHDFSFGESCSVCGKGATAGLEFALNSDEKSYTLVGIGSYSGQDLIIPDFHQGKSVTIIDDFAFSNNTSLTSVEIPKSIEIIGESAFAGCKNIVSISFAKGVKTIENSAFLNCSSLAEVNIPSSVVELQGYVIFGGIFEGCTSLRKATVGGESFSETPVEICLDMFKNCISLEEVYIGNNVSVIGSNAFEGCSSLKTLSLGNHIERIGDYVFVGCTSLPYIDLPDSVKTIGPGAFANLSNLTYVSFGYGLEEIYESAFLNCTSIAEITIPSSVKTLHGYFSFGGIFEGCTSLKKATIGGPSYSVQPIALAMYMFKNCTALEEVYIGNNVGTIGYSSFEGCSSLLSVTIPGSVTLIDSYAFANCASIASITIEHSDDYPIRNVGSNIFDNCPQMTRIFYTGTENDWKSIYKDSESGYPFDLTPYYYSESAPLAHGDFWYFNSAGEQRIWNVSEKVFAAAYSSRNFVNIFGSESTSYSTLFLNKFLEDKYFQAGLASWENLHLVADSSLSDPFREISKKNLYKIAIYDLLCGEVNSQDNIEAFINNSNNAYISSLINDIFGNSYDLEAIKNLPCKLSYIPKGISVITTVYDFFLNSSKNMYEAIEKYAMYVTLSEMDVYFRDVLLEIADDYSNPEDLRIAAVECASIFSTSIDDIKLDLVNGIVNATPKATMTLFLDTVWGTLIKGVDPSLGLIQSTAKGILFIANLGFNMDETIQAYYKLYVAVQLESSLRNIIHNTERDYMRFSNLLAAERYIYSIDLYKTSVLLGYDYSNILLTESMKNTQLSNSEIEAYKSMMNQITAAKEEKNSLYARFDSLTHNSYVKYYTYG